MKSRINEHLSKHNIQATFLDINTYDYYDTHISLHSESLCCCLLFPYISIPNISNRKKHGNKYKIDVKIKAL